MGGGDFPKLYISSSWVRIRLHTEIQLTRLPASTLFWWGCYCHCDCDGVKTKSTHSLLSKDFGWSLTIKQDKDFDFLLGDLLIILNNPLCFIDPLG